LLKSIRTTVDQEIAAVEAMLVPNPVNEIGRNFCQWADWFFDPLKGRIDCYIPLDFAIYSYGVCLGVFPSEDIFNEKIAKYALYKGLVLNPVINMRQTAELIGETRVIYLHYPNNDYDHSIYDPSSGEKKPFSIEIEDLVLKSNS